MNLKALQTIENLITKGLIPKVFFDIEYRHVYAYIEEYGKIFGCSKRNISDIRLSMRYAGMNLLEYIENTTGIKPSKNKAGFIYMISNPAWPTAVKIGLTSDVYKRLANYQTYSPHRDFKIEKYEFVINKATAEKLIISSLPRFQGEWVDKNTAMNTFTGVITQLAE